MGRYDRRFRYPQESHGHDLTGYNFLNLHFGTWSPLLSGLFSINDTWYQRLAITAFLTRWHIRSQALGLGK